MSGFDRLFNNIKNKNNNYTISSGNNNYNINSNNNYLKWAADQIQLQLLKKSEKKQKKAKINMLQLKSTSKLFKK